MHDFMPSVLLVTLGLLQTLQHAFCTPIVVFPVNKMSNRQHKN